MSSYEKALLPQVTRQSSNADNAPSHSVDIAPQAPLIQHQTLHPRSSHSTHTVCNRYEVNAPALLQGHRCYVDASTTPDQHNHLPTTAGPGIFFLLMQEQNTEAIYIKAKLHACTSVLMAEAAALALASQVAHKLQITGINYLSDSEQLVHFLNKQDLTNPPDWWIKPYTQLYSNNTISASATIYKIHRSLNTTAHNLATQAFQNLST